MKLWVCGSLVLALCGSVWSAQEFEIEPGWSHVEFQVSNFAVHTVNGRFKSFSGSVLYDEADVTRSSVTVTIPVVGIDTGIKKRDEHLQTADFFETVQFPDITFRSERIEKKGDAYVMSGPLTIKGHTKEVDLIFTFNVEKSQEGTQTLHAEARGTLNRHDFGINYGSNFSVGKEVQILIHIQAIP